MTAPDGGKTSPGPILPGDGDPNRFKSGFCAFGRCSTSLVTGSIILVIGVVLLLVQQGVLNGDLVFRFWPVLIVVLGIAKILQSETTGGRVFGGFIVLIGLVFQLDVFNFGFIRWEQIWPLFLILLGALLIWGTLESRRLESSGSLDTHFTQWSIFGGTQRRMISRDFRGGDIMNVFGGCELDLTDAAIAGVPAVIEVNSIFGGCELRVPEGWNVNWRGIGLFGGFSDKRRPLLSRGSGGAGASVSPATSAPGAYAAGPGEGGQTLVIRGILMFGAVVVKN